MKTTKGLYGTEIPSLEQLIKFLSICDTPLGDLCNDIIRDENFPYNDAELAWHYLNSIRIGKDYLDEPIRRLKTIYSTIYKS